MPTARRYTTITLRPHPIQFLINELPLLLLCLSALAYGGTAAPFSLPSMYAGLMLLPLLCYKYERLRGTLYIITGEQIKKGEGLLTRDEDYVELYRVVDYVERKTLLQQLFGLKTVTILSGDRTTPRLTLQGIPATQDLVALIRERVEYTKTQKPIYEITNRL
jgi:uncharacterized membrane protein YdbT with pleckstrin-like domain